MTTHPKLAVRAASVPAGNKVVTSALPVVFLAILSILCGCSVAAHADVHLSGLFSAGAVLQRDHPILVWGTASNGEKVTVELHDRRASTVARNGKWALTLPPVAAGGPYKLFVTGHNRIALANILVGDVYLCSGESNMEWPLALAANGEEAAAAANDPALRLFVVPRGTSDTPEPSIGGRWQTCAPGSARVFSAVAYFFGRALRRSLGVPIGLIQSAWSGTPAQAWTSRSALLSNPALAPLVSAYETDRAAYRTALQEYKEARQRALDEAEGNTAPVAERLPQPPIDPTGQTSPSTLFNAMIAPIAPYGISAVVWYQGESDTGATSQYRTLFPVLIADWRSDWKRPDLPFLFVQLAPFMQKRDEPQESPWAELRDAQTHTSLTVPRTGMAVITDLGDETDIHPREKERVGERLALLARSIVYGESIEASGPVYDSMTVDGDKITLRFRRTDGGLMVHGGDSLQDFTIAGEDGRFVSAAATIRGDTIVVTSPRIAHPAAVRYGWADFPQGSLWNRADLPASPFRTDNLPYSTEP